MSQFRLGKLAPLALAAVLAYSKPALSGEWVFEDVDRIVAISDIHGAYDAMVRTLRNASVIDDAGAWSGGTTHLVIVGDILDRGPDSRPAMDLLMRIEDEATAAGGRVHVLIGNHEAMNLIGDLRYVSKAEYAAFAHEETTDERNRWFEVYATRRASSNAPEEEQRESFDNQFPAGFFAHRRAFASDGEYGRWLLTKPILVVINGTAFVHGGMAPIIGEIGLRGVNETLHSEMVGYVRELDVLIEAGMLLPTDNYYDHPGLLKNLAAALVTEEDIAAAVSAVIKLNDSELHSSDGPLWYRGNVACTEVIEADKLDKSLRAIGAHRVVIGHTPTRGRDILERFDGRIIEVDTGMLNSYYEGDGNALVIMGDQVSVINESGEHLASPVPHPRYVGARSAGLDTAGIEQLLATGDVMAERQDTIGNHIISVSNGEQLVDAVFVKAPKSGLYPEIAAYRLDLLLELNMVPVAVKRTLDGVEGTMQFLPAGTVNEEWRRETRRGGSAMCPLSQQWDAMLVFDALAFNEGRVGTTILYDRSTWQLILTGHGRTFSTSKARPKYLEKVQLNVGPAWKKVLGELTDERLEQSLGDVLDGRRLRALGARRDKLLMSR